jgi:hypothetical protein
VIVERIRSLANLMVVRGCALAYKIADRRVPGLIASAVVVTM